MKIDAILYFITVLIAILTGWVTAHHTISTECIRLGSFYVADKTFVCQEKK